MKRRIIDAHAHTFPDDLAARAIKHLIGNSGETAFTDGTVRGLKESMRHNGIEFSVSLPVSTRPGQTPSINTFAMAGLGDREIVPFGTVHPDYADYRTEIARLRDAGIQGVKFHPDYQEFFVDEERLFPIYEALMEAGLIVLFHAGVDIGLKPPYHCLPDKLARVLELFPRMKVIAAHFGGFQMWDEVDRHLVGRNLYLETSYTLAWLDHGKFVDMARRHGMERVLFGTDSPWADQGREVELIGQSGLTDEELDKVFFANAARLLKLPG